MLFLVSAIGSAYPEYGLGPIGGMGPDALIPFIIYRIIGGVGVGIASMLSPLYIAEIAPPARRGRLVTYQQIAIVGGMTIVYFVNWAIAAQGDDAWVLSTGWRYMLLSGTLPAALFLLLLLVAPETPRWLVMKGEIEKARQVLVRLARTRDEAHGTLQDIERSLAVTNGRLFAFGALVIVVGLMLSIFQQFIGINAVLYYAPLMFQNMGASTDSALLQTIIVGVANIVFSLIALVTVDRLGRKPLLIIGGVVMAVSMISLGFLFHSGNVGTAALVAVVAYIAGFALSWGPVVWVLLVRDLPERHQGQGDGACGGCAMDREPVRVLVVQGARRQFGAERPVQPRLCLLDLRRDELARRLVRLALRSGNEGPQARSHPESVDETSGGGAGVRPCQGERDGVVVRAAWTPQ